MSAFLGIAKTVEIALTVATTPKTLVQIVAPTNHRVKVCAWGVWFDGVSASDAQVLVRLLRQSTAGTMSALTPVKVDDSIAETLQTTAQHTASAEPTAGDVLKNINVPPSSGGYEEQCPYGQEYIMGGGDRIGIEATVGANVNGVAWIRFEE